MSNNVAKTFHDSFEAALKLTDRKAQLTAISTALNTAFGLNLTLDSTATMKTALQTADLPVSPASPAGTYIVPTFTILVGTIETVVPVLEINYAARTQEEA